MTRATSPGTPAMDAADLLARDIHAGIFGLGSWLKQIDL